MIRTLTFFAILTTVITSLVLTGGCKKETKEDEIIKKETPDTIAPVITLTNDDMWHNWVAQFSAPSYTDPGATAADDHDGTVAVTVTGSVNMFSAGTYTLNYAVTDSAGNASSKNRSVIVDGGLFLAHGYFVENFIGTTSMGSYHDTIIASTITHNKFWLPRFANYLNALVYATTADTTITIPPQTVQTGIPPGYVNHTFSGSGTYSNVTPLTFTINYSDSSPLGTVNGHCIFTAQ